MRTVKFGIISPKNRGENKNIIETTTQIYIHIESPSWRSLNPLKGSLNHPKKGTLNHQVGDVFFNLPTCNFPIPWISQAIAKYSHL